ncbi:putative zinc-activated ligand-gated ion channel [Triplophysa rosa]|uniref:Zinc-activated ligand-gated ion channel n=1 Tax=Triplophysa rosa TaxID=992332 RepID=A0A9W7T4E2_TRIRA|nr:putative zinc-activated ligand-gated ion channel [Triplophysa rosa]
MNVHLNVETFLQYWITEISWNSSEFCNIDRFVIQKDLFWTPDTVVLESIKTEFAAIEPPYVRLYDFGMMDMFDFLTLVTTCKMDLHSFPFDTQICSLSLRSLAHSDDELIFAQSESSQGLTSESQRIFQTQGEWELLDINTSTNNSYAMWVSQSQIIFQITIKRRPLLYIVNLIVPVFCFLVLDVASFFINASVSEKLGFKVTLLLSISVLLLILNEKLPSTANDIPLIGIYCSGVFTLIGISILETIFVNVLIRKGEDTKSEKPATATGQDGGVRDLNNSLDTVTSGYEEVTCILNILKLILMEFRAVTQQHQPKESLCWIRAARIIDVTFTAIYIITIVVFLSLLGKVWIVL